MIRKKTGRVSKPGKTGTGTARERQRTLEAVGRAAGAIAHDLKNLLTPIVAYGDMLRSKSGVDESLRTYIDEIVAAAERCAALASQLQSFSPKPVKTQVQDIRPAIMSAVDGLRKKLPDNIRIEVQLDESPARVAISAPDVEQILVELAKNARDAMPGGGKMCISLGLTEVKRGSEPARLGVPVGAYIVVSVRDEGGGIEEQVRGRLFEPYVTTKPKEQARGFGLARVYGMVRRHGGYILFDSRPGSGSCFRVYFPRASAG